MMVEKLKDLANTCYVYESGDGVFQVGDRGTDYIVDIHTKSCSCMRWQKNGVTCIHVIACCRNERVDPITLVDNCYSVAMEAQRVLYHYNCLYLTKKQLSPKNFINNVDINLHKKHMTDI